MTLLIDTVIIHYLWLIIYETFFIKYQMNPYTSILKIPIALLWIHSFMVKPIVSSHPWPIVDVWGKFYATFTV